jgi:2,3-diaminopropionate biosynthesis protein SbnB
MPESSLLLLTASDVQSLLAGQESKIIDLVRTAYEAHHRGESSLPHSTFLRFPDDPANRIIALPAYLAGELGGAGIKWVSSFPGNVHQGLDRASAVVVLNSLATGRPTVLMEGSIVNAKRTAASAALAAHTLHGNKAVESVGVIGCGLINLEIQRFLRSKFPSIRRLCVYDLDVDRAEQFKRACAEQFDRLDVEVACDVKSVLRSAPVISLATTACRPHMTDLSGLASGATILHISLRDLAPEVLLACDNVADDIDHVCRARTSIHLAEQLSGSRDFVRCALAEITSGKVAARRDDESIAVFSPFGLGVLDVAVGEFVHRRAIQEGRGMRIDSFFPGAGPSTARPPGHSSQASRSAFREPDASSSTKVA